MKHTYTYLFSGVFVVVLALLAVSHLTANKKPASRLVMEYAENIIREKKPSPPEAARFYAFVASVYADAEDEAGVRAALDADARIIGDIYPDKATDSVAMMRSIARKERKWSLPLSWFGHKEATLTISKYEERDKNDSFHTLKWDGKLPVGSQYWVKRDKAPAAPVAGGWNRWVIDASPTIPPPYDFMSDVYKEDLARVKDAVAHIDDQKRALVNFWGGTPGTETPSGIWQERLWATTRADNLSDREYAYAQKVLAESLADSFMECWKVKYTYWATRPDMADPSLATPVMPNPPFPSYPSGHSTISATAAAVLTSLFPQRKDVYWSDAAAARDSRLNAGIHFPHDNDEGFVLGRKIGERIAALLKLSPLRGQAPGEIPLPTEPRKASYVKGNYLYALRQSTGGAFFIATDAPLRGKVASGWSLDELSKDDFWDPRICATMPTLILPGGDILVRETKVSADGAGVLAGHTTFEYFDMSRRTLTSMTPPFPSLGSLYLTKDGLPFAFLNNNGVPETMTINLSRMVMNPVSFGRDFKKDDSVSSCGQSACVHTKDGDVIFTGDAFLNFPLNDQIKTQNDIRAREKDFLAKQGGGIFGQKASLLSTSKGNSYFEIVNPLDAYGFAYYEQAATTTTKGITPVFVSDPHAKAFHYTIGFGGASE